MSGNLFPSGFFRETLKSIRSALANGRHNDVEAIVDDVFQRAQISSEENPTPELELTLAAGECEEQADWEGAETAYRQILALPNLESMVESKALLDLAALYLITGRESEGLDKSRLAVAAARKDEDSIWLPMVLETLAGQLLRIGSVDEANQTVSEALARVEEEEQFDQLRASLITLRAQCEVETSELSSAEENLERARVLMQPMVECDIAAGVQSDLASWWTVRARLSTSLQNHEDAVEAWQNSVALRRKVVEIPHAESVYSMLAIARALAGLADALTTCNRIEERDFALTEQKSILDRINA